MTERATFSALPSGTTTGRNGLKRQCSPQTVVKAKPAVRQRLECQSTQSRYRTRHMVAREAPSRGDDSTRKQLLPFFDGNEATNHENCSNKRSRCDTNRIFSKAPTDADLQIIETSNAKLIQHRETSDLGNSKSSVDAEILSGARNSTGVVSLTELGMKCWNEDGKCELGLSSRPVPVNSTHLLGIAESARKSPILELDNNAEKQLFFKPQSQIDDNYDSIIENPTETNAQDADLTNNYKIRRLSKENTSEQLQQKENKAFGDSSESNSSDLSCVISTGMSSSIKNMRDVCNRRSFYESTTYKICCHGISPDLINQKAAHLFSKGHVLDTACISARLFACYILLEEWNTFRSVPYSTSENCMGTDLPLLPLLQSLVTVESVSLHPSESCQTPSFSKSKRNSSKKPLSSQRSSSVPRNRRIHFSGIDCSSTIPPVDRVSGSLSHQRSSINALVDAKLRINDLEHNVKSMTVSSLRSLIQFFQHSLAQQSELTLICAKAVSLQFSPNRISSACTLYVREFKIILNRLLNQVSKNENMPWQPIIEEKSYDIAQSEHLALAVEKRLADLVGQTIRYCLRMMLNPQPPRLSPKDKSYSQQAKSFSKVSTLVELRMPNDDSSEALDDACISALVSIALQALFEYCGPEPLLMLTAGVEDQGKETTLVIVFDPDIPISFCASSSSQREIPINSPYVFIDDEDLIEIQHDIRDATSFLAASKASRFLLDLFTTKAVECEIERLGGWRDVEFYAKISRKFRLWEVCDFDSHLVPLSNHSSFVRRLQGLCSNFEEQAPSCESALDALTERMRRCAKSKFVQRNSPNIKSVLDALVDSKERIASFPVVTTNAVPSAVC